MTERTFVKSVLLVLVLVFGTATMAAAQSDAADCLYETKVSQELAQVLGWSEEKVGISLMDVVQAGVIRTYCFTGKTDCEDSQKDASGGIKSGCYRNSEGKYCYDLQFASTSSETGLGNFYGTVTDSQGAALQGVTVTMDGQGTRQVQVTNAQGQFRYLGVAAGPWSLRIELEGFATESTLVFVTADSNAVKGFELAPACEGL